MQTRTDAPALLFTMLKSLSENKIGSIVLVSALLLPPAVWAGGKRTVQMRWEDLNGLVVGERVTVEGNFPPARGRVVAIDPGGIDLEKGRRLGREHIKRIRIVRYLGRGRLLGKRIGGATGLLLGLAGAAAIGLKEGSGSNPSQKVAAAALGVGGLPTGLIIGYLLGRKADEEIVWIELIAQSCD